MPFHSRTSLIAHRDHDFRRSHLNDKDSSINEEKAAPMGPPALSDIVAGTLPLPVQSRRSKRSARLERVHWASFKRRLGVGTAPSASSTFQPDDSGDDYSTGQAPLTRVGEEEVDFIDEVVVDREWSQELKGSITHSEYGTPDQTNNAFGTGTDRESLYAHSEDCWSKCGPLVFLRWRCWPVVYDFFVSRFVDEKSETQYNRENWFLKKVRTHAQRYSTSDSPRS